MAMTHAETSQNSLLQNSEPLLLVDASGFIFRAYHALPPLTRPDGTPVGAVMGFCSMILKLTTQYPHAQILIVFDAARNNFRNEIYANYKANRSETPEDLIPQFPLIREAAQAFGLPIIEREGFEADDLIATYATQCARHGQRALIISSDKDLMQLVEPLVTLYDPMKNIELGADAVLEKFGVAPISVIDVQALAGDSIDNVPGVPGIGVKTAAELIQQFGTLENLLENAHTIKQPKRRESLIEHKEAALISKQLVTLKRDVPNIPAVNEFAQRSLDEAVLRKFFEQNNFKSLLNRLPQNINQPIIAPTISQEKKETKQKNYKLITDENSLQEFVKDALNERVVAFDTETTGLTPAASELVGISLSYKEAEACYIPIAHGKAIDLLSERGVHAPPQIKLQKVLEILKPLFNAKHILKVAHNAKYDLQFFIKEGIEIAPIADTMLLSYVLNGTNHAHNLDFLAKHYCDHDMISYDSLTGTGKNRLPFAEIEIEKACDYAAEDADFTLRLFNIFAPRIAADKMSVIADDVELPLIPVIAMMELNGIRVDQNILKQLSQEFGQKIYTLEQEIYKIAGTEFNVASPKQLGQILFEKLNLQGGSKTKTGDWSTSVDVLEMLDQQGHEIAAKLLEFRHLSKLKSTYTEALQEAINVKTGRVHTSFSMAGTSTGRLSSSDPNLQNIPIKTEEGRSIRKAFVAEEGSVLISADYSQIELRMAAEMAGIEALKNAFLNGEDIHKRTAAEVFELKLDAVSGELRRSAKAINFGIIYGISAFGLGKQLDIETSEAARYIKNYFARFPELNNYMERIKAEARENGFVKTYFGRKCFVQGIADKNPARRGFAERQAINAPLQGTAADLMKLAMSGIYRRICNENLPLKMLLQVHDELVFETPEGRAQEMAEIIKFEMERVNPFQIPLTAEAGIAKNWSEAH